MPRCGASENKSGRVLFGWGKGRQAVGWVWSSKDNETHPLRSAPPLPWRGVQGRTSSLHELHTPVH